MAESAARWVNATLRAWADKCPDEVQVIYYSRGGDGGVSRVINHTSGFTFEVVPSPESPYRQDRNIEVT